MIWRAGGKGGGSGGGEGARGVVREQNLENAAVVSFTICFMSERLSVFEIHHICDSIKAMESAFLRKVLPPSSGLV